MWQFFVNRALTYSKSSINALKLIIYIQYGILIDKHNLIYNICTA